MNILLVLPFVIPLLVSGMVLLLWARKPWRERVVVVGAAGHVASAVALSWQVVRDGTLAVQLGGWPAPYGVTFVADLLAVSILLGVAIVGACGALYSLASIGDDLVGRGYYSLYMALVAGATGATLVGDIFSLYVMIEVMLTASFVLLGMGGRPVQMAGAFKYVVLNLIASVLLLSAVGLLYRAADTLNIADLARQLPGLQAGGVIVPIALLFLVALGIKSAAFPLFFWLPASYHTPPAVVSAVFAGLLTKVGIYILIRVFTVVFVVDAVWMRQLLLGVAAFTMVAGVLGAVVQNDFRRILSVHIVSQVGYMIMGLALYTRLGIAAAIYFTVHNMFVKTNLFFVSGVVWRFHGTYALNSLGGVYAKRAGWAALFIVPALSLAGVPPLSGFIGKLALLEAAVQAQSFVVAGVSLFVSVWTLYSMTKIWKEVFWKPLPASADAAAQVDDRQELRGGRHGLVLWPCVVLTAISVAMGIFAGPVLDVCLRAADQLLDRGDYMRSVLGGEF